MIEEISPILLGGMGLRPSEIGELTLSEVNELLRAYEWRVDKEMRVKAWELAHILNCWTKKGKKIRPKDIYKGKKEE